MSSTIVSVITAALAGGGVSPLAYLTYRKVKKNERSQEVINSGKLELEGRRVESEAYAQAQRINKDVVDGLQDEINRLRVELQEERARVTALTIQLEELRRALSARMNQFGIPQERNRGQDG